MNGFDIIIKDNFLDSDIFKKIHERIDMYNYFPQTNMIEGITNIWFSCDAEEEIVKIVLKK